MHNDQKNQFEIVAANYVKYLYGALIALWGCRSHCSTAKNSNWSERLEYYQLFAFSSWITADTYVFMYL